jgi:hypothetical protein
MSQAYTGICPYPGSPNYQYRRLPMGLNVSNGIFAEKCNSVLAEIPDSITFVIPLHDDMLVYCKNKSARACQTFKKHGLKLSTTKCRLFRNKVTFVGHIISVDDSGIVRMLAMNDKCSAIRHMPRPQTVRQVKWFIGAVTFLSRYLPRLQELLKPLHDLTKKKRNFLLANRT